MNDEKKCVWKGGRCLTHNIDLVKVARVVRKVSKERRDDGEMVDKERSIKVSSLSCMVQAQLNKQSRRQGVIKTSNMGSDFKARGLVINSAIHVAPKLSPLTVRKRLIA